MKPLNHVARKQQQQQFILAFSTFIIMLFITGFLTVKIGEKGVNVLEEKHKRYVNIFRDKAALSFEIDEIIKRLNQTHSKSRNLTQYRQFQILISDIRDNVTERIKKDDNPENFLVYTEMIETIKVIQENFDVYKEESDKLDFIEDQLEKCKLKYIEKQEKRNR